MGTPLGDFVRAKRDSTSPETLGLPSRSRRRAPGLRRSELADLAGISVEYLTRIEQGRDRNPSPSVVVALATALRLDGTERGHLGYLAKITGGACAGQGEPERPRVDVRPEVLATFELLGDAVAVITNRLGDVLVHTTGFEALMSASGLLAEDHPNLTRYVFTDPRAREFFLDWDRVADEQAFDLWLGPSAAISEWFRAELAPVAGPEFTGRLDQHLSPPAGPLGIRHPEIGELHWHRERLTLPSTDQQEILVYLPADEATAQAWEALRLRTHGGLRAVT